MKIKLTLPASWGRNPTISAFLERDGRLSGHEFFVDPLRQEADAWFVFDEVNPEDNFCRVPKDGVFFVTAESVWADDHWLHPERHQFLMQFSHVFSSHVSNHPNFHASPPFLPWMVHGNHGTTWVPHARDLTALRAAPEPEKVHPLSVICSTKTRHPGHRVRLEFVKRLKAHFGETLHWYGNGVNPIADKWVGLAPYYATISIENQVKPDLYTEKFFDPLLAHTIPIYAGAPNIGDFFEVPDEWRINLRDFAGSVQTIEELLHSRGKENARLIQQNRDIALGEAHFLQRICDIVHVFEPAQGVHDLYLKTVEGPNRKRVFLPKSMAVALRRLSPRMSFF